MLAKGIENQKQLMGALLTRDTFDRFELVEGTVTTFARFSVDGLWHEKFYEDDPSEEHPVRFTPWKLLKEHILAVIRGKRTPLSFRFVFRLSDEEMQALLRESSIPEETANVTALLLNLTFDGTAMMLTTGVSHQTFSTDRSAEHAWDAYILRFFSETDIELSDLAAALLR